jgi:peptidoglycan/LPS O-acetylase OafA/YrhL
MTGPMTDPAETAPAETALPMADRAGTAAPPAEGGPEPSIGRIPALDGIRAIGIVLVLFFHGGFSWAGGGFFGVDVFFVLSGFLITGLLVSEFRQNGHIGLRRFWGHRIRRLVPALLALLMAVALYAVFFAPSDTLGQLRGDAVATLIYGNNWHQIFSSQGYFAALATPRPLLHTWSLSIEEQFYLVWPLVVLAVLHFTRSLRVLLTITVVGAVASALEMAWLYGNGSGQSRVYYGTDTRAQALLIGAALAIVLAQPVSRRPAGGPATATSLVRSVSLGPVTRAVMVGLGGAGLAAVGWMAVGESSATTWIYRGGFGLVALATAAVIACVALVPASPWAQALSWRPVRYIGAISYGLYLWHWPIFVAVDTARTGLTGWSLFGVKVGLSVAVAAASFHFLEMPIRRGVLAGWRGWLAAPLAVGGTAVMVLATTAGAAPAITAQAAGSSVSSASTGSDAGTRADIPVVPAGTTGPIRALLVGDSEASFLGFGLGPGSGAANVDYAGDGVFGCGLVQDTTQFHGTIVPQASGELGGRVTVSCSSQLARWKADLHAFHPDVVLLADGEYEVRNQLVDGKWLHLGKPAFDALELQAIQAAVTTLRSTGATVVLLTAPYYRQPEQANGAPWPEDDPRRVDDYNALLRKAAAAAGPGVVVENLNAHLDPGGQYAQTIDGVDVRFADGIHVTAAGATLVAPWLLGQVGSLGTANRAAAGTTTTTTATAPAAPSP